MSFWEKHVSSNHEALPLRYLKLVIHSPRGFLILQDKLEPKNHFVTKWLIFGLCTLLPLAIITHAAVRWSGEINRAAVI